MAQLKEPLEERIIRERKLLWEEHRQFEPLWQEIHELVYPRSTEITVINSPGSQRTRKLFDSTAVIAATRLAAAMAGVVTPSTIQWFDYGLPSLPGVQVPKVVVDWVQGNASTTFDILQATNFDTEIQELYHDLVTFGTGAFFIIDDDGIPMFRTLHPQEYAIWTDSNGRVTKLVRDVQMTVREAIVTFGEENLAPEMKRELEENPTTALDQRCTFVQWIAYRKDEAMGFPVDNFPVASIYVDLKYKYVVKKTGFQEWPCPVVRWASSSGESYGRSPAFDSLPDIASLNKAEELALKAWAMAVMPPLLARHDGILGTPDLRPARISFVNDEGALNWFPPGTNLDIETVQREDKRRAIWNAFFMDQVQFVPERGKTPPSAEEVRARLNIMLQILGPTLSRLEYELLIPTLDRVFGILSRSGHIQPAPLAVLQYAERTGKSLNVQFIGPIARAKRQAESQKLDIMLATVGNAMAVDPNAMDVLDVDEWVREKAKVEMVPRNLIRDRAKVKEIRDGRAQAEAEAREAEQMRTGSEAVRNVTPLLQGK